MLSFFLWITKCILSSFITSIWLEYQNILISTEGQKHSGLCSARMRHNNVQYPQAEKETGLEGLYPTHM